MGLMVQVFLLEVVQLLEDRETSPYRRPMENTQVHFVQQNFLLVPYPVQCWCLVDLRKVMLVLWIVVEAFAGFK